MPNHLILEIPSALESRLASSLASGEVVHIKLKGAFKEALVCTDRRAIILKSGFMTGSAFGVNVFQAPYRNISSVDVNFGLMSGAFEISTGNGSGKKKSYWGTSGDDTKARNAPNAIALVSGMPEQFREASNFIMEKVYGVDQSRGSPPPTKAFSIADELRKLADLRNDGILTADEFEAQKAALMAGSAPGPFAAPTRVKDDECDPDYSVSDAMIQRAMQDHTAQAEKPNVSPKAATFGRRV